MFEIEKLVYIYGQKGGWVGGNRLLRTFFPAQYTFFLAVSISSFRIGFGPAGGGEGEGGRKKSVDKPQARFLYPLRISAHFFTHLKHFVNSF